MDTGEESAAAAHTVDTAQAVAVLQQKDVEISHLQQRVASLSRQLHEALATGSHNNGSGGPNNKRRQPQHPLSPHAMNIVVRDDGSGTASGVRTVGGKPIVATQRERLGRTASIATRRALEQQHAAAAAAAAAHDAQLQQQQQAAAARGPHFAMPPPLPPKPSSAASATQSLGPHLSPPPFLTRILDMFQQPTASMEYLRSRQFAKDLLKLCQKVKVVLEREPRVVFVQSPAYVFGDIHGNLEDLHFFSDNLWRLGMSLTAGSFVFLGDYVDRGLNCLECVAYLLAVKWQLPKKVILLRGNHETRDVNGWEEHYGERSFLWQCRSRFGDDVGYRVWEACNQVFDRMPLSAVIDEDIFCVHGGIPRSVSANTTRIQDILTVPRVAGINPPYEHEDDTYQQVASDCIWSDPASEYQEQTTVDPVTGFGESLRGGGAICFGNTAVTNFLTQHDLSYIMRAHEAHADGVAICKGARVFTVFSTSQDHNQGAHAMAGCMLVDTDKLQVINRSPAYKNQYVHRRDSESLANLTESEIQKRIQLGLVTTTGIPEEDNAEEQVEEEWDDLKDDDEEVGGGDDASHSSAGKVSNEFVFGVGRRSSVDLNRLSGNSHDEILMAASEWDPESGSTESNNQHHQYHNEPNKRFKRPSVDRIDEEGVEDDEEIETVDGDNEDQDIELADAQG